jgi:thymidylate synthase
MDYRNAAYALVGLGNELLANGQEVISRNGTVKELLHVDIMIENPRERCLVLSHRNDNIFAKIAETLWVMAGRNDIKWLSAYLPRAVDYSDDGTSWRAGYGARLRRYGYHFDNSFNDPGVDQIKAVYNLLRKDKYSRRAVMSMWDPTTDYGDSKDIPCNDWFQFQARDTKLHMDVAQRSSDLLWGFSGTNTFEWSVLHEAMASWLGLDVGEFHYHIGNLHLYKPHWERVAKIIEDFVPFNPLVHYPTGTIYEHQINPIHIWTDYQDFHDDLMTVFQLEEQARDGDFQVIPADVVRDPFLSSCAGMLQLYWQLETVKDGGNVLIDLDRIPAHSDFYAAAREHIGRKHLVLP